jgi:hypothetical protein
MSLAMAIYVGETSFAQLEKSTQQAKAMIDSWTTETTTFKESSQNFNPGLPVDPYNNFGHNRNQITKSDYENYLWLFGSKRV